MDTAETNVDANRRPSLSEACRLSLVIPVYNEQGSLKTLFEEIDAVSAMIPNPVEVIFVDDGSDDGSWNIIREMQQSDERIRALRFRRNFGKAAALAAGFSLAAGDRVFTLDADLQDDPKEIPRFLEKLDEGFDVVSGWKKVRHDPLHKTVPSKFFNQMVSSLTGVRLHDHNCGFKCYRREVIEEIQLYGEFHRFTPVLAGARGFKIGELTVEHRARKHGKSKYGWTRIVRGFLDLLTVKFLTSYQHRPQHLLGTLGLICAAAGTLGLTYLALVWSLTNYFGAEFEPLHRRPLLTLSATALLLGFQMLSIGLIAELITARNHDVSEIYSIAERLGDRSDSEIGKVNNETT